MGELDRMIRRIALRDARRLVSQGYSANEAAALATPGAWMAFRLEVLMELRADDQDENWKIGEPPDPHSCLPSGQSEVDVREHC